MSGAGVAISQLPVAASVVNSDLLPVVEVGSTPFVTKRATIGQILANALPVTGGTINGPLTVAGNLVVSAHSFFLDNSQNIWWKDTGGNYQPVIWLDGGNSVIIRPHGGAFAVQRPDGGDNFLFIDGNGIATFAHYVGLNAGANVGGSGINFTSFYGTHNIGFGWDGGALQMFVDSTYVGQIANRDYANTAGDPRYLLKTGDTCTGSLVVNGNFACNNNVQSNTLGVNNDASSNRFFTNYLQSNGDCQVSGNFNCNNTVTSTAVKANATLYASSDNNFYLTTSGGARLINFQPSYFFDFNIGSGVLAYFVPGFAAFVWGGDGSTTQQGNLTVLTGTGFKPGGGVWAATSDARLKKDITSYDRGCEELCRLRPVTWRAKDGPDDGPVFTGLTAQEAQEVMPELVFEHEEHLCLDGTPLIYSLINAVKELNGRLKALEAKA